MNIRKHSAVAAMALAMALTGMIATASAANDSTGSSTPMPRNATSNDNEIGRNMKSDKMSSDHMKSDKMSSDHMKSDKMSGDSTKHDNMPGREVGR